MPYNKDTRDRMEAWPKKGTKAALQKKAKKQKKALGAYLNEVLEGAAK